MEVFAEEQKHIQMSFILFCRIRNGPSLLCIIDRLYKGLARGERKADQRNVLERELPDTTFHNRRT